MESNYRFCFQENQFWGDCIPCTPTVFNNAIDATVAWKIDTRQKVETAISEGQSLEPFAQERDFIDFCAKKRDDKNFTALTLAMQLLQWTNSLKNSLPCFIFAVKDFKAVPKTDKDGNPVLDKDGNPKLYHRRKLEGIEHLSGLFMFDADKLVIDPREIYERTLVPGFTWKILLAHKTSSGHGLRLVCEARPELGNIADNQICLARDLGLMGMKGSTGKPVVDDSCIDATRISYCPRKEDIYYVDEQHLFNF